MLLAEFIKEGSRALESLYSAKEAHNIVLMLCESLLGTRSYTHIVEPEYQIPASRQGDLDGALSRLCSAEPIQHVLGEAEFCGRRFKVTPDVLIPRPETEVLVREAVAVASRLQRMRLSYGSNAAPVRILDLCTGSGCIAWSVALSVPGVRVVAVDVSEAALKVAAGQPFAREAKDLGASAPQFVQADVLDAGQPFDLGQFDLILSNPPYILPSEREQMHPNVLDHEPGLALFVPEEDPMVFCRAIALWAQRSMTPEGRAIVELNDALAEDSRAVFEAAGFRHTAFLHDFFDRNRFVVFSKNPL